MMMVHIYGPMVGHTLQEERCSLIYYIKFYTTKQIKAKSG